MHRKKSTMEGIIQTLKSQTMPTLKTTIRDSSLLANIDNLLVLHCHRNLIKTPPQSPAMKSSTIPANRSKFILLVLISCNLILLLLTELTPDSQVENITKQGKNHEMKVEPVSFLASRFSVMIIAYLSTLTYLRKDLSLEELISTVRWTWQRPAITLLYLELITTASSSLLLMLIAFAKATRGVVALEALLLLSSLALFSWLGPVLFAYSDIACKLSVVASVVEHCQGQAALERASELIQGRKLFGFVLSCVLMVVEQVPFMVFGQKKSNGDQWSIGAVFLLMMNALVKFAVYFVHTVFYYECKRGHRKGRQEEVFN